METQQRLDLQELRNVAETRQQEQFQFLLKRLLQHMEYYIALTVPLERILAFLPIFEQHYPDETWVRQLLLVINNYGKAPENDIAELALQEGFTVAGVGNYLKAVYDLTQAMQDKHTPEARIGYMTSAVVNANMADLAYAWYGERDKAWEKVRANQEDEQAKRIAYIFWTDADTAHRDKQNWLDIADNIEAKLRRLEKTTS